MQKNKGGHALMLNVTLPKKVTEVVDQLIADRPTTRRRVGEPHVTLAFFERDLSVEAGDKIRSLAAAVAQSSDMPRRLSLRSIALFGNHVVALTERSKSLAALRAFVQKATPLNLFIEPRFQPHVTLFVDDDPDLLPYLVIPLVRVQVCSVVAKVGNTLYETAIGP